MAKQVSFGEFVKLLAALLNRDEVAMPFTNEEPWHVVFYKLKKESEPSKPEFFNRIRFDWDGPYPKSQQLSEFLQALHWTASVSASNPLYETITLPAELQDMWLSQYDALEENAKKFLTTAKEHARTEFATTK